MPSEDVDLDVDIDVGDSLYTVNGASFKRIRIINPKGKTAKFIVAITILMSFFIGLYLLVHGLEFSAFIVSMNTVAETIDVNPLAVVVTVFGKEIDADIEWASEHSGYDPSTCDGHDEPLKISFNLRNLGIHNVDDIVGLDTVPRIDELYLNGSQLSDADVTALARMPFAKTLLVLDLSSNNSRVTVFPTAAFPLLETIWLGGGKLASFDAIEPSKSLEWLEVSSTGIQTIIREDLAKFPNIIQLRVFFNV